MDTKLDELGALIADALPGAVTAHEVTHGVLSITANAADIVRVTTLLRDDPRYAERAGKVSALTRDVSQVLDAFLPQLGERVRPDPKAQSVVFHPPCTLQNAMKLGGATERLLTALGAQLAPFEEGLGQRPGIAERRPDVGQVAANEVADRLGSFRLCRAQRRRTDRLPSRSARFEA